MNFVFFFAKYRMCIGSMCPQTVAFLQWEFFPFCLKVKFILMEIVMNIK